MLINSLYLLSLVIWVGGIIFFSFITAPSIFKILPPEYASKTISALFNKYYPLGIVSGLVAFVSLIFSAIKTGHWPVLKIILVLIMLGLTLYSSINIHPKARALKEEIQSATGKTEVGFLQEEFDRVHHISVINNAVVLLLGLILIVITARSFIL